MNKRITNRAELVFSYIVTLFIWIQYPLAAYSGESDQIFVARGKLIGAVQHSIISSSARYEISETIYGEFPKQSVEVNFYPMALKGELPAEAILLLQKPSDAPLFYALGKDPVLGILPYTPENLARARSLTEEDLKDNPIEMHITEAKAREVLESFLSRMNLLGRGVLRLKRAPFGWMGLWESDISEPIAFFVGDDGEIKQARYFGGGQVEPYQDEIPDQPEPFAEPLPDWPAGSYKVEEVELEYAALRASRENSGSAPSYHEPVRYRVIERLKGSFDPGVQVVEIDKAADAYIQFAKGNHADELFPHEAILIVFSVSEPSVVSPVDTLASRGILPATPGNLQRVKAATLESLTANPKEMQISLPEAAAIVKRHLSARDLWPPKGTWEINRLGFGWCFINPANGFVALYVGDDGEVKYHFDEQDMPE